MDFYDKLKRLKDELTRLFHEGISKEKAYDQLQANTDFSSIGKRADIHSLYKHLEKKNKIAAKDKKQIEAWENEEKQIIANMECMKDYRQTSSQYLLYDGIDSNTEMYMGTWQSRFLLTNNYDKNVHNFKILDMFQNVSKSFVIQKRSILFRMHFLAFPFVLLHEYSLTNHFRLLHFDFENDSLHEVQSFEYDGGYFIFVDQFSSSKFILTKRGEMHNCKLFNGQIQIGDSFEIEWQRNPLTTSYFNDHLYSLKFDRQNNIAKILSYNLELKESKNFELSPFPEHLCFADLEENVLVGRCGWVKNHVFTTVRFNLTDEYGIAFAEPETRKWTFIEFLTKIPINRIQFVDSQDLMICAYEQEVYKIPMCKPDLLRNKAWITLVKKFKKDAKIDDPYAEARNFLPLNSEMQQFIFCED